MAVTSRFVYGRRSAETVAPPLRCGLAEMDGSGTLPPESATILSVQSTSEPYYADEHVLAYPVEYLAGIDLYNAGEFHAAHDAWEERWMGPVAPDEKLFLQAMIQSAVAFHHLQIGRPGAARQMYLAAKEKFARLGCDAFMSLDLDDYQSQLDRALSWLLSAPDPREIEQPEIVPPLIRLVVADEQKRM